jgi:fructokinase
MTQQFWEGTDMILCCGEALIDMLPRETTLGEKGFAPYAGGAVFNTAVALGRLGQPTGFFTGLSDDMMGDILRDTLRASNVDFSYCATLSRPTTIAFVKLVQGQASYAFYDENTAGRMITEDHLPDLADECEALHFGAISLIPEPCGSTYEALLKTRASAARDLARSQYPSRLHHGQGFAHAAHSADGRHVRHPEVLRRGSRLVRPGRRYGRTCTPLASSWRQASRCHARSRRARQGYTADHRVTVPSEKVTVVDTVGAGDTFDAGVLASLKLQGLLTKAHVAKLTEAEIRNALSLGSKAAAVTVSRAGANPPYAHEIGLPAPHA